MLNFFIGLFVIEFFVTMLLVYLVQKIYVKYSIHKMYKQVYGDTKPEDVNKDK